MKFKYLLLLPVLALSFAGCDTDNSDVYHQELVVQSSMYIGQPMKIRLEYTIPWNAYYDPAAQSVEGAEVAITVGGVTYPLSEAQSGNPGTYQAAADAPLVAPFTDYALFVAMEGDTITASTTSAGPIAITETNIIPNSEATPDTFEYGAENPTVHWMRDERDRGYAVFIENLEPDWFEDYRAVGEDNGPCSGSVSAYPVVNKDSLAVPNIVLCATGLHRLRLLTCDQALFDYIQTTALGSQDNYPTSNLSGGQGVFWAGDADTAYFYLVDNIED